MRKLIGKALVGPGRLSADALIRRRVLR